ncbi:MAG: ImmA/IrrE family metallo-endopeptidase [Solirubrobacteraceae bacterium]
MLAEFEAYYQIGDVPPVPVERIAESLLGLLIEEHDDMRSLPNAPTDLGRLSGMVDPPTKTIWLDRIECEKSRGRRRFTIAHECGHWVLHLERGAGVGVCCRPTDVVDRPSLELTRLAVREREANDFASELLMPEILVTRQARETKGNISALAERFNVSVPAMRLRVQTLGLVAAWRR